MLDPAAFWGSVREPTVPVTRLIVPLLTALPLACALAGPARGACGILTAELGSASACTQSVRFTLTDLLTSPRNPTAPLGRTTKVDGLDTLVSPILRDTS